MPHRSPDHAPEIIEALAPLLAGHRRSWAERCQAHGLSIIGFQVLALLEMHGPLTMGHLADQLGVATSNATGIVGRMAERGIVARQHDDEDRRRVLVDLTPDGRRLVGEIEAQRREQVTRLIGALDTAQQQRLLQVVHDLRGAAETLGKPA
jgi:DNA-binding MarR family transcriptional regulator